MKSPRVGLRVAIAVAASLLSLQAPLAQDRGATAAQLSEIRARAELADAIVARIARGSESRTLSPGWSVALAQQLLGTSADQLRDLAGQPVLDYRKAVTKPAVRGSSIGDDKLLGDAGGDLTFIPVSPCRLADTRNAGGPIQFNAPRAFDVAASAAQGGAASCSTSIAGQPTGAAYAINLTVLNMTGTGFVGVRSIGDTAVTSLVNFTAPGQQVNNFVIVRNSLASNNEFEIFSSSSVDVIVDIFGIFVAPEATALDCTTPASPSGSSSAGNIAPGATLIFASSCAVGYQITGGGCAFFHTDQTPPTTSDSNIVVNRSARGVDSGVFLNNWVCQWTNNDANTTYRVQVRPVCCRTPGR